MAYFTLIGKSFAFRVKFAFVCVAIGAEEVILATVIVPSCLYFPLSVEVELFDARYICELFHFDFVCDGEHLLLVLLRLHEEGLSTVICRQAFVGPLLQALRTRLVREPIEQLIVVALSCRRQQHRIQVLLRYLAFNLVVAATYLNIDEFLAGLKRLSKLVVEAPAHQDDLYQHNVDHVCPAHRVCDAEVCRVVRHD